MSFARNAFCFISVTAFVTASAQVGTTSRVSVGAGGNQANAGSYSPAVSPNRGFVAFVSHATNLIAGDTNNLLDIFVRDRQGSTTSRVSVATGGGQSNGASDTPSLSGDGRFVAYTSVATNLVAGDTNGLQDCFVHDRVLNTTVRISVDSNENEANAISSYPWVSANGRYVAFFSVATNLVPNDTNNVSDVFMRDLLLGTTTRVSVSQAGVQSNGRSEYPVPSADGRYVAFHSGADNLALNDLNGFWDCMIKDMMTGEVHIVSVATGGAQGNGHSGGVGFSTNGRYTVFSSLATNLDGPDTNGVNDTFIHDIVTGTTERVSISTAGGEGDGESIGGVVSDDGRIITFSTIATNLVQGDTNGTWDVVFRDRATNTTTFASRSILGGPGNNQSHSPAISADGIDIVFGSVASDLITGDTNNSFDIFVHDRTALVVPSSYTLLRGGLVSGNLNSLAFSDNDRLVLRPGPVFTSQQPPIEVAVDAVSPYGTATGIRFSVEAHCSSGNIGQIISLFNFQTQTYDVLSNAAPGTTDTITVVSITKDCDRYLGPAQEVRATISYKAQGPVFVYPWQARIDHVFWSIAP